MEAEAEGEGKRPGRAISALWLMKATRTHTPSLGLDNPLVWGYRIGGLVFL